MNSTAQSSVEAYIEGVALHHLEAIEAIFSAISQLDGANKTVSALASHGCYLAQKMSDSLDTERCQLEDARTMAKGVSTAA
jgi:hypothetical protein